MEPGSGSSEGREAKQRKPLKDRPCDLPIPSATTPASVRTAPYPHNLTPNPSVLHPHYQARDRLMSWIPVDLPLALGEQAPSEAECRRVKETMIHAWEEETCASYGMGLLMWHCFCDSKGVLERERAPVKQSLLSAFVVHMATAYSRKTIVNYLSAVHAWHLLHSIPWALEKKEMEIMLQAAEKLTPKSSKKKKCLPYTPSFISTIRQQMDLELPLDTAVFTCLTTCFYTLARLGEFMVHTLASFTPDKHVTTQNLTYDQDRNNLVVTVLHLPSTKVASSEGEDIYWASQNGDTDPMAVLQNHLHINQPPETMHLFTYWAKHTRHPLTKSKFIERVNNTTCAAGLKPLQGHGIRIGSTLEYLLQGVPFNVMKVKGHWAGDSFLLYLRKHAIIIAPYIQAVPEVQDEFICYTMPPVTF